MAIVLESGQKAPHFRLQDQEGRPISLGDYAGRWLVMWWYPRACSEICSVQGRAIVPLVDEFRAAGADIIGVSFDSQELNMLFAEQEDIPFPLLSDPTMEIGTVYGIKRSPEDPFADAPHRVTYLIDPEGCIAKAYHVDDASGHASVMLADLKTMVNGELSG